MRPKTVNKDLPPRMVAMRRKRKNGSEWVAYFYFGKDEHGNRKQVPLGSDLSEAKVKWAALETGKSLDVIARPHGQKLMCELFDHYLKSREFTSLGIKTQRGYEAHIKQLRKVFDTAPINKITPAMVSAYRANRTAVVQANREVTMLSTLFNLARGWGMLDGANPASGLRKNKETARRYYADNEVWDLVLEHAAQELKDAMRLSYLTGQRPADVCKMRFSDIRDGYLEVEQNKTEARLRIRLQRDDGTLYELGELIEELRARKVSSLFLVATDKGKPLTDYTRRLRFDAARTKAADAAETRGDKALAERIRAFWYADIRPKSASDEKQLSDASARLGHTDQQITKTVYRRAGQTVTPLR
jgi:integrase